MNTKQKIQQASYPQRERNFLRTITSATSFQVIVGKSANNNCLLWQDEFYMEAYIEYFDQPVILSKVDTIEFLKYLKISQSHSNYFIHPIWGEEGKALSAETLFTMIMGHIESDGDYYDSLRESGLL